MTQPTKRRPHRLQHAVVAAWLRGKPGEWTVLGDWPSLQSAQSTADRIRLGFQVYGPKGTYEARAEATKSGARVVARYVGDTARNDAAWTEAIAALGVGGAE